MRAHHSLEEILEECFSREAFLLRAVKSRSTTDAYPEATRLVPVDSANDIADNFELESADRLPFIFPVAAFKPKAGEEYRCVLRLREKIMEAVPANRVLLKTKGQWDQAARLTEFDLTFELDPNGKWFCRHPKTGAYIRVFDLEMKPDEDGKCRFAKGTVALRGAATRTFYVLGSPETVKKLTEGAIHALEVYSDGKEEDFTRAPRFRLAGRDYTAFEAMGNPIIGGVEISDIPHFRQNAVEPLISILERWIGRILLPLLHPDAVAQRSIGYRDQRKILEVMEETRCQVGYLMEWVKRWANWYDSDAHLRLASGLPPRPLPLPIGRQPRKSKPLVELTKEELEKMLFKPRRTPTPVPTERSQPSKSKPEGMATVAEQVGDETVKAVRERIAEAAAATNTVIKAEPKRGRRKKDPEHDADEKKPRVVTAKTRRDQAQETDDDPPDEPSAGDPTPELEPSANNGHTNFGLPVEVQAMLAEAKNNHGRPPTAPPTTHLEQDPAKPDTRKCVGCDLFVAIPKEGWHGDISCEHHEAPTPRKSRNSRLSAEGRILQLRPEYRRPVTTETPA